MKSLRYSIIPALTLFAVTANTHAMSFYDVAPTAAIDTCPAGACVVIDQQFSASGDIAAYGLMNLATTETIWMMSYKVQAPSTYTSLIDDHGDIASSTTSLVGEVWLSAPDQLQSGSANTFTLFTEQVVDTATASHVYEMFENSPGSGALSFMMSASDAAAGTAERTITGGDNPVPGVDVGGLDIPSNLALDVLIESYARREATLNLVGFNYSGSNFELDLDNVAAGALLFSYTDEYPTDFGYFSYYDRELYVTSAVPVPAAIWLLLSGLLSLIAMTRRDES